MLAGVPGTIKDLSSVDLSGENMSCGGNSAEAILANTESVGTGEDSSSATISEKGIFSDASGKEFSFSRKVAAARRSSLVLLSFKSKGRVLFFVAVQMHSFKASSEFEGTVE